MELADQAIAHPDGSFTLTTVVEHFTLYAVLRHEGRGFFDRGLGFKGMSPAIWLGGTLRQMLDRAPGADSFWVFSGGRPFAHLPGAPEPVNRLFSIRDLDGVIPGGTTVLVVLPADGVPQPQRPAPAMAWRVADRPVPWCAVPRALTAAALGVDVLRRRTWR
ncbi:MAG: hypothetical protein FJZ92_09370 [Chloroflexi bacterium]|nr:hypothetical protein [Chloroflexota bacterium]